MGLLNCIFHPDQKHDIQLQLPLPLFLTQQPMTIQLYERIALLLQKITMEMIPILVSFFELKSHT